MDRGGKCTYRKSLTKKRERKKMSKILDVKVFLFIYFYFLPFDLYIVKASADSMAYDPAYIFMLNWK